MSISLLKYHRIWSFYGKARFTQVLKWHDVQLPRSIVIFMNEYLIIFANKIYLKIMIHLFSKGKENVCTLFGGY